MLPLTANESAAAAATAANDNAAVPPAQSSAADAASDVSHNNTARATPLQSSRSTATAPTVPAAQPHPLAQRRPLPASLPTLTLHASTAHDSANAAIIAQLNTLLAQLQCDLPEKYVELFNRGIRYYIAGDWQVAGRYLVKFQALHREKMCTNGAVTTVDGPSNLILQFMGKHAFQAPKGWMGYRKLEKK